MLDNRKPEELPELNNKMVKVSRPQETRGAFLTLAAPYPSVRMCVCAEHSQGGVP